MSQDKTLAVIGLGLIGGSFSLAMLREKTFAKHIGVDTNSQHADTALSRSIVHEILDLDAALTLADIIVLSIPVDATARLLPHILDHCKKEAVVFDMGSTKYQMALSVDTHPNRGRYVAAHPMAGTEYSGPEAALTTLFDGKTYIICDSEKSDKDALEKVESYFDSLQMRKVYMPAHQHDMHVAYISHISHISSFVLASTVLQKEKSTKTIFDLASGGFESTVRLAKSPPSMWLPIFYQNKEYILEVLATYIRQMEEFKMDILEENSESLLSKMQDANRIKKIIG